MYSTGTANENYFSFIIRHAQLGTTNWTSLADVKLFFSESGRGNIEYVYQFIFHSSIP